MGNFRCPVLDGFCGSSIEDDYRFYAAFENSICTEYVTEKFYRALDRNIIPLVYGGLNYTQHAPPHSFIDVADFESFEKLAEYLKFLENNPEEYVKYFWWKKYYRVMNNQINLCAICVLLHTQHSQTRVHYYNDIKK